MKNLYYQLWVDAIVNSKDYKNKEPGWKTNILFIISLANSLNAVMLFLWLDYFNIYSYKIVFDLNSNSILINALEGFVNYGIPFFVINYFLILYRDRYKKLIVKYQHFKGKFSLFYTLGSILCFVITVLFMW